MTRWWQNIREVCVDHVAWELVCMRGLFAWLVWSVLPEFIPWTTQPVPNGLAHIIDLTFLADSTIYTPLRLTALAALLFYTIGVVPLLSLGYAGALLTAVGTLENSQGAIGHHLQLVCLVAGGQWLAYLATHFRGGQAGGSERWWLSSIETHRRAVQMAKLVIAVAYVASACVKLIASGGLWVWQLPDIALQLIKTHANVHYDTLVPQAAWASETLPGLIVAHPNLTRLFFLPGLLLELLAFLALCGRKTGFAIAAGLLVMHLLIRVVMQLSFNAHEWLLLIFFLNLPYLLYLAVRWVAARCDK